MKHDSLLSKTHKCDKSSQEVTNTMEKNTVDSAGIQMHMIGKLYIYTWSVPYKA